MKTNQRFTLRLLNLPLLLKETRRSLCKWSRRQIGKKRLSGLKKRGGRYQESLAKKISPPLAWSFAAHLLLLLSPSSSLSCCASADCYQPHTSPFIRVRVRAKRSACRQPIGRDSSGRRLLANGHPDAPDVTHSALSILRAREAKRAKWRQQNKLKR